MADCKACEPRCRLAGQRVEQARYRITDGTRALYAQRIADRVAVVDVPIDVPGRVLLVERHVDSLAELQSLVAAYIEHSTQAGCPAVIAQRRQVDQLVDALA